MDINALSVWWRWSARGVPIVTEMSCRHPAHWAPDVQLVESGRIMPGRILDILRREATPPIVTETGFVSLAGEKFGEHSRLVPVSVSKPVP